MKNSFISSCFLIATISIAYYVSGCKKDNNNSSKLIDEITGTYIAYDTVIVNNPGGFLCGSDMYNTYSFVITKESETTVIISKLNYCDSVKASVTETNITLLPSSTCYDNYNPAVAKSGSTLKFTYTTIPGAGCTGDGTTKAVKQ